MNTKSDVHCKQVTDHEIKLLCMYYITLFSNIWSLTVFRMLCSSYCRQFQNFLQAGRRAFLIQNIYFPLMACISSFKLMLNNGESTLYCWWNPRGNGLGCKCLNLLLSICNEAGHITRAKRWGMPVEDWCEPGNHYLNTQTLAIEMQDEHNDK